MATSTARPSYAPDVPPQDITEGSEADRVLRWARREFDKLARAPSNTTFFQYLALNVAPTKPKEGMVVYADGTNWNPGFGEGAYEYTSGGIWRPMFAPSGTVFGLQHTNPTGTASLVGVMMGLGDTFLFTPKGTRAVFFISGQINNTVAADGALASLRVNSGTAPANGAALQGANLAQQAITACPAGVIFPFTLINVAVGLTPGTQYWFDCGLLAITGGTTSIFNLAGGAFEI